MLIPIRLSPSNSSSALSAPALGNFCFSIGDFRDDGSDNSDFELNRPEYRGASILLARRNFGSGSSREHAPWALGDYGFRVIIAPSFADIFYNNCFKNGMLPIRLADDAVNDLFQRCAKHPGYQLNVDLESRRLTDDFGLSLPFEVEDFRRHCLLHGLDDIGLTLEHADKIAAFEAEARNGRGLVVLPAERERKPICRTNSMRTRSFAVTPRRK